MTLDLSIRLSAWWQTRRLPEQVQHVITLRRWTDRDAYEAVRDGRVLPWRQDARSGASVFHPSGNLRFDRVIEAFERHGYCLIAEDRAVVSKSGTYGGVTVPAIRLTFHREADMRRAQ